MSRGVLFCNGELNDLPYHRSLLKDDDFIIAVDGGGRYCQAMEILPNIAIGDFDSLSAELKSYYEEKGVEILPYPADKNYIDMVLAIEVARQRGCRELLILGALGGKRQDMNFGNIMVLTAYDEYILMKNQFTEIRCLRSGHEFSVDGTVGDYLSILPISDKVVTGKSRGLKYQLEGLVFQRGETRGISNELTKASASLCLKQGEAILMIQKR